MFTDALISKLRNFNHIFVKNIVQNNLISAGASRCSALRGACQSAPVMTLSASFLNGDDPDLQDRRESVQARRVATACAHPGEARTQKRR